MKYLEWLKAYDKSHITHPSRQDVWDGAWNYQQSKIDKAVFLLKLLDATAKSKNFKISSLEINEVIQELLK